MKQFITTLAAMMLIIGSAMAGAEQVKEKAKQQRDLNNEQQGITPPAPAPGVPAATPSAPGQPATPPQGINPAQQALLHHLQTDITVINVGTAATVEQKQHLVDDLVPLSKGAKPSKAALTKLAGDLATAFAEKAIPANDLTQLVKDINVVVNCGFLTAAQAQTFVAQAQTILKTAGVSEPVVQAVGADLKAIVNEIQKNKPKLYQ